MSNMAFWNEGAPRFVRSGRVDRVTGRTIGTKADPDLDLYPVKYVGPKAGKFEVQAANVNTLVNAEIIVTRSLTGYKPIEGIRDDKLEASRKTKGAMLTDSQWEVIAELDSSRNPGKPRPMPQATKDKRLAIILAHDAFEAAIALENDPAVLVAMQPAFPVEEEI